MNGSVDSPYRTPGTSVGTALPDDVLRKTNVFLVFVLAFVTFGFYIPIWFLRRRRALNALGGELSVGPFVIVIVSFSVMNVLNLTAPSAESTQSVIALLFQAIGGIVILVQSFEVKNILENATGPDDEKEFLLAAPKLSSVLTFFATIFYLQHKINVMDSVGAKTPPLKSRLLLWAIALAGSLGVIVVSAFIGWMQSVTAFQTQIRTNLQQNAVIAAHIGSIESLEIDWVASGDESDEDVYVFDISGKKGAGRLTAELDEAVVSSGTLLMSSGESYELVPEP